MRVEAYLANAYQQMSGAARGASNLLSRVASAVGSWINSFSLQPVARSETKSTPQLAQLEADQQVPTGLFQRCLSPRKTQRTCEANPSLNESMKNKVMLDYPQFCVQLEALKETLSGKEDWAGIYSVLVSAVNISPSDLGSDYKRLKSNAYTLMQGDNTLTFYTDTELSRKELTRLFDLPGQWGEAIGREHLVRIRAESRRIEGEFSNEEMNQLMKCESALVFSSVWVDLSSSSRMASTDSKFI